MICKSPHPTCQPECFNNGAGATLGIVTQVCTGIFGLIHLCISVFHMAKFKLWLQDRSGTFYLTEHDPSSHLDTVMPSLKASLVYNLHREKKFRIWFPFWDGLFAEMRENKTDEVARLIGERWLEIKDQAEDSGILRIMAWLNQSNPDILAAREKILTVLEGIDVYCDKSCLEADGSGVYTQAVTRF